MSHYNWAAFLLQEECHFTDPHGNSDINSITKRKVFFEDLQNKRKATHDMKRLAAAYDLVFENVDDYNELNRFHVKAQQKNKNILSFLCRTGMIAKKLNSNKTKNIHALDHEQEFLRIFRHKKSCLLYTSPSPRDS